MSLAAAQAEPTPRQMGRASFLAGTCASLGWEGSRERAMAAGEAYDARNPAADPAARQVEITEGIRAAQTDMLAVADAFRSTGDVATFKAAIASRCDSVVRDIPEMLGPPRAPRRRSTPRSPTSSARPVANSLLADGFALAVGEGLGL